MTARLPLQAADVVVVGNGIVGLASAAALADAGLRVTVVGGPQRGQASRAAGGMLAPGVERATGPAHDFAIAARERYPGYVAMLAERTGVAVSFERRGILQVALDDARAAELSGDLARDARWLGSTELARLEPALAHARGALLHERDGSVDNRALMSALELLLERHPRARRVAQPAEGVEWDGAHPVVRVMGGEIVHGDRVVLAAGAWTPLLEGLPRTLPIEPVRGQMLSLAAAPLRHVVYGPGGYLVPRGERTVVGSTMERTAFDDEPTAEGLARVRATGEAICPALAGVPAVEQWAGLRPVTPDLLPIIGLDPDRPALVHACGHSRNGILLGPLTGDCVAALVTGAPLPADLSPFDPARFA
ncbi:MAG TPA: FAD-dependent oxidoreductase [Gemmatimonadales bacterium]